MAMIRVGWSEAQQPTAGELNSAPPQSSPATIPATDDDGYLFFAAPAGTAAPLEAHFDNSPMDIASAFERRTTLTAADGTRWTPWVTNAAQSAAILGTGSRRLILRFTAEGDPTLAEIRWACRIDTEGAEEDRRLEQLLAMAKVRADRQAPDAPAAIRREALLMAICWRHEGQTDYSANWWQRSGAAGMLKPWAVRRAGTIG